nr:hypothetical protein [Tanacetum cinerariifolium]
MTIVAEYMIIVGDENCPPMLDKPQYESWKSHMKLYIQGKDHGRIILNSAENGPLVWPTVEQEDGTMSILLSIIPEFPKTYGTELSYLCKACHYQVQVNTKFLNGLPPEWGKFKIDVKLARDLHMSNFDQLYAYLEQHEAHANKFCFMCERSLDPLALVANYHQPPSQFNNYHPQYTTPQYQQRPLPPTQHVYSSPSPINPYEAPHHPQ